MLRRIVLFFSTLLEAKINKFRKILLLSCKQREKNHLGHTQYIKINLDISSDFTI